MKRINVSLMMFVLIFYIFNLYVMGSVITDNLEDNEMEHHDKVVLSAALQTFGLYGIVLMMWAMSHFMLRIKFEYKAWWIHVIWRNLFIIMFFISYVTFNIGLQEIVI